MCFVMVRRTRDLALVRKSIGSGESVGGARARELRSGLFYAQHVQVPHQCVSKPARGVSERDCCRDRSVSAKSPFDIWMIHVKFTNFVSEFSGNTSRHRNYYVHDHVLESPSLVFALRPM